eukprot:687167-Pelagomonas_calceolata.AAC.5
MEAPVTKAFQHGVLPSEGLMQDPWRVMMRRPSSPSTPSSLSFSVPAASIPAMPAPAANPAALDHPMPIPFPAIAAHWEPFWAAPTVAAAAAVVVDVDDNVEGVCADVGAGGCADAAAMLRASCAMSALAHFQNARPWGVRQVLYHEGSSASSQAYLLGPMYQASLTLSKARPGCT